MKFSDIPVIGGIPSSIRDYFKTTLQIVIENRFFIKKRLPLDHKQFKESLKYFEYGVVAGLLFLVPFFVFHGQSMSKFIFVIQQIVAIFIYCYVLHLFLKILKAKNSSFQNVLTVMGYLWGLMFLSNFVISLPVLIAIGPDFLFRGADTSWTESVDQDTLMTYFFINTLGSLIFVILWLFFVLPWMKDAFAISKKRSLVALLLTGIPCGIVIGFILGPVFRKLETFLGDWLIAI